MAAPGLFDYYSEGYEKYSILADDFKIPETVDYFTPEDQTRYECSGVMVPNPKRGAKTYTKNGKIICIGIYRDLGRPTTEAKLIESCNWLRSGKRLLIQSPVLHGFRKGEVVKVFNSSVPSLEGAIVEVFDGYRFELETYEYGPTSGAQLAYQRKRDKNFREENVVFRLIPSFNLLTIAEVYELLGINPSIAPAVDDLSSLLNVTSGDQTLIPKVRSVSINFYSPVAKESQSIKNDFLYSQLFDEARKPLDLKFFDNGQLRPTKHVDTKYKTSETMINAPVVEEQWADYTPDYNSKVYIYDFYGYLINDDQRAPYFSNTIITADPSSASGIKIELAGSNELKYQGKFFHDEFGNQVVGISSKNTTVVKRQQIPLRINQFHLPLKAPDVRI